MIRFENNPDKNIYGLEKSQINGELALKWRSSGHTMFLILLGEDQQKVDLREDALKRTLEEVFTSDLLRRLQEEGVANVKEMEIQLFLLSHNDLMKNSGFPIKEKPGIFAVYGIDLSGEEPILYVNQENGLPLNVFALLLEVSIEQAPYYIEKKSLFNKKRIYSGYCEVRVPKPLPGLASGTLKYTVEDITLPFPDSFVKNGGAFYVKSEESTPLNFSTTNRGIRIK
ncbi:MAG: hypothetical protein IJC26_05390 [Clostridia bacterium]|nr:hypothetical protein [Clostridia bacterium]